MARKINFNAGPSTLPVEVLEKLRDGLVDFQGSGLSLVEESHRSPLYEEVHQAALSGFRSLLAIPDDFAILFLGGGATLQFAMVPMNLLTDGSSCDYVLSGSWAKKAFEDAVKIGKAVAVFDGKAGGYRSLPDSVAYNGDAAYVHITSNETIGGIQWPVFPDTGSVPLVADMSSDIMSRPVDWSRISLAYAGAQKNLGPAGVTVVILRKDLLSRCSEKLPAYLSYANHAEADSLYNTPPVFSIWALSLVLDWVGEAGGVAEMRRRAEKRAGIVYGAMDESGGFYRSPVDSRYRSNMNVVFRLPDEDMEKAFISKAIKAGMIGLKGHRSVGGCRASMYNALPIEGAETLAEFMREFKRKQG